VHVLVQKNLQRKDYLVWLTNLQVLSTCSLYPCSHTICLQIQLQILMWWGLSFLEYRDGIEEIESLDRHFAPGTTRQELVIFSLQQICSCSFSQCIFCAMSLGFQVLDALRRFPGLGSSLHLHSSIFFTGKKSCQVLTWKIWWPI
jgi:hypothetical protein